MKRSLSKVLGYTAVALIGAVGAVAFAASPAQAITHQTEVHHTASPSVTATRTASATPTPTVTATVTPTVAATPTTAAPTTPAASVSPSTVGQELPVTGSKTVLIVGVGLIVLALGLLAFFVKPKKRPTFRA